MEAEEVLSAHLASLAVVGECVQTEGEGLPDVSQRANVPITQERIGVDATEWGRLVYSRSLSTRVGSVVRRMSLLSPPVPADNGECWYHADVRSLVDRIGELNERYIVKVVDGCGALFRFVQRSPGRMWKELCDGLRSLRDSSIWAKLSTSIALILVFVETHLLLKPEHIPVSEVRDYLELFGTLIIFVGTIEIGLGVLLTKEEERRLSNKTPLTVVGEGENEDVNIGLLLKNASRRFRSGMSIVAMGTFFLVVKVTLAVFHAGEPAVVQCMPIVEAPGSRAQPQDNHSSSEVRKRPFRCEF
ncbi:hypothetical protein [Paraburkholderia flagellata]|uniref:hypothetical protein n=1 Tax=Paraburkholderia flagellata TaxID=2883241 RepID=UPI001F3E7BF3|nr:hypothetical protein [Paraburkholderia flagellata]